MSRFALLAATAASMSNAVTAARAAAPPAGETTPLETIQHLEDEFASTFNKQDFVGLQDFYHPDGDLVPPTADKFLHHADVPNFFQQSFDAGMKSVHLESLNVVVETDALWHEIGNVTSNVDPGGNLYYARWVKPDAQHAWVMAFDMMTVGQGFAPSAAAAASTQHQQQQRLRASGSGEAVKPATEGDDGGGDDKQKPSNSTQVVAAIEGLWTALYQTGDYAGVADLYNPGAQLIPPVESAEFLTQDKFADFFEKANFGEGARREPTVTLQEADTLIHELGHMTTAAGSTSYYVRWVKPNASWQVAFDIMSVGDETK